MTKTDVQVIDFHVHALRPERLRPDVVALLKSSTGEEDVAAFLNKYLNPDALVALLASQGVAKATVFAEFSPTTTGVITNDEIAEICGRHDELIPVANVNPFVCNVAVEARRCIETLRCKAFKMLPSYQGFLPNETRLYPLYELAQHHCLPIIFHTGSSIFAGSRHRLADPMLLDDIAVDFPELTIIQSHSGRGFWYKEALFLSRRHPHVYLEIAGLPPAKLLTYFPDLEKDSHKVIFGSDWPAFSKIKSNIEAIKKLPLSEQAIRRILWGNASRILARAACLE